MSEEKPLTNNSQDLVPSPLISLGSSGEVLLVEKSTQSLYLYDHEYNLVKTYRVTTGKTKGDKKREGDLKTPEGVYYFTEVIDPKGLPARYGVMAIATDYPNPIDRLHKKGGSGIWLHATDEPDRISKPRDTRGCVVTTNADILTLAETITLNSTPMVIVKKIDYLKKQSVELKREEFLEFLNTWKRSIEEHDINKHKQLYSRSFKAEKNDPLKKITLKQKGSDDPVSVDLDDIKILSHGDALVVSFKLNYYIGGTKKAFGIKYLYLSIEENAWKIISEKWHELPDKEHQKNSSQI